MTLTWEAYQNEAIKTLNQDLDIKEAIISTSWGLIGEFGEVTDILKKFRFHGHTLNSDRLKDELGDVYWYLAVASKLLMVDIVQIREILDYSLADLIPNINGDIADFATIAPEYKDYPASQRNLLNRIAFSLECLCKHFSFNKEEIWELNVSKLSIRYENGFTTDASVNRTN